MKITELIENIPDRTTIRLNEKEKLQLAQVMQRMHETDVSKGIKFSIGWTAHNLKNVTEQLCPADYEVVFMKKRKTMPTEKVIY